MKYNWQQKDWPAFKYTTEVVEDMLLQFSEKAGRVLGILEALPEESREGTVIEIILAEAMKTSEIEGEHPNRKDVLSSIRKNLGLHETASFIKDKSAAGLGELMIDVRKTYAEPLTIDKLFAWHRMLMGSTSRLRVGDWRKHEDPMQVVSGAIGKERVHFEAPPSAQVPKEMEAFVGWFNETAPGGKKEIKKAPVRAALAHLYFESIHPFEDGNGRIGRAVAEKALAQSLGRPVILSLSRTIESNKSSYYGSLEQAQRSTEVTPWVEYFVSTTLAAQAEAERQIDFTLKKVKFFDRFRDQLTERQFLVVGRMLEEGPVGFEGGMNARKYISITKASKATATRDMQQLLELGVFVLVGKSGRSTRYEIKLS